MVSVGLPIVLAVKLGMLFFGSDHLHYLFVLESGSHVAQADL